MTRDQAAEIQRRLMDVASALDLARDAICELDDDDRKLFAPSLRTIVSELHFEMLREITDRFPELERPRAPPSIDSELTWDEVSLPASVTAAELDRLILSVMTSRFLKVMRILVDADRLCRERSWPIAAEMVAARIQVLAEDGRIDHRGDLRKWGFSEIRLKS